MIDFNNLEVTFASKTNSELQAASRLFSLFNQQWLVSVSSSIGLRLVEWGFPVNWAVKNTIFKQFCGGETLTECQNTINALGKYNLNVILDYGVEAKDTEADYDLTLTQIKKTITAASLLKNRRIISIKITGLCKMEILEKIDANQALNETEKQAYARFENRLHEALTLAASLNVKVFVDAEESWIQDATDALVNAMMEQYNKTQAVVYNTYQMYRHDRLEYVSKSILHAKQNNYILGAKLVRGAYMEKERKRAMKLGYNSPINIDKKATDELFDQALERCLTHISNVAICCASHNEKSTLLCMEIMEKLTIQPNHDHVCFSQLYGMSDNLSYGLAKAGYNVSKYLPFGPVGDVLPYLIRRAQENSSMSGLMGRELKMIKDEIKRRKKLTKNN
jgi:proline dehydrogenase